MSTTIDTLLQQKKNNLITIRPGATVFEALKLMAEKNIGALPVVEGGRLVGMFSERDYARKVGLMGKTSKGLTVEEIMTPDVLYVTPDKTTDDCMALMTNKRVRHLPVMDGGSLVGLVSIGDIVKKIITDHEFTIEQLEKYITS